MKGIFLLLVLGLVIAGCTTPQAPPGAEDGPQVGKGSITFDGNVYTITGTEVTWMDNPPYDATVRIELRGSDEMMMSIVITTDRLLENPEQTYKFSELYGDANVVHDTSIVIFKDDSYTEYAVEVWNEAMGGYEKGGLEVTITSFTKTVGSTVKGNFGGILINRNDITDKKDISGNFEGILTEIS